MELYLLELLVNYCVQLLCDSEKRVLLLHACKPDFVKSNYIYMLNMKLMFYSPYNVFKKQIHRTKESISVGSQN